MGLGLLVDQEVDPLVGLLGGLSLVFLDLLDLVHPLVGQCQQGIVLLLPVLLMVGLVSWSSYEDLCLLGQNMVFSLGFY